MNKWIKCDIGVFEVANFITYDTGTDNVYIELNGVPLHGFHSKSVLDNSIKKFLLSPTAVIFDINTLEME